MNVPRLQKRTEMALLSYENFRSRKGGGGFILNKKQYGKADRKVIIGKKIMIILMVLRLI